MADLIVINKERDAVYFNDSKLVIDVTKTCIKIIPKNDNTKEFTANFNQNFFLFKNILAIFSPNEVRNSLALIFCNEIKSKKVFDVIQKTKIKFGMQVSYLNMQSTFENLFFHPIIDKIKLNENGSPNCFINILQVFLESLSQNELRNYKNIIKEAKLMKVFPSLFNKHCSDDKDETHLFPFQARNYKGVDADGEPPQKLQKLHQSNQGGLDCNKSANERTQLLKDVVSSFKLETFDNNLGGENEKDNNNNLISEDDDDFYLEEENQELRDSEDAYSESESDYWVSEEEENYENIKNKATLNPIELPKHYLDHYKTFIETPNFEIINYNRHGIQKSRLIIFFSFNKKSCYEYFFNNEKQYYQCCGCASKNKKVTARVFENDEGKNIIGLGNLEHVCEPRDYKPEKFQDNEKVYKPNYEIFEYQRFGMKQKKLSIFIEAQKVLCYNYSWDSKKKSFICVKCQNRKHSSVRATLRKDEKEYISLSQKPHICSPINYENYKKSLQLKILKRPHFDLFEKRWKGKLVKRLEIFINENKNFGYEYAWNETYKTFYCVNCYFKNKLYVYARHIKNEKEEDYIELSSKKHLCEPLNLVAIIKNEISNKGKDENIVVVKPLYLKTTGKIVNLPNFYLYDVPKISSTNMRLAIFVENNKSLCYTYYFCNGSKIFVCSECSAMKKHVTARLHQNKEGENFVEMIQIKHFCKPKTFLLRFKPNYKIEEILQDDILRKILTVKSLDNNNGPDFTYVWNNKNCFVCTKCRSKGKHISAKIRKDKNGEEYIELFNIVHVCRQLKAEM